MADHFDRMVGSLIKTFGESRPARVALITAMLLSLLLTHMDTALAGDVSPGPTTVVEKTDMGSKTMLIALFVMIAVMAAALYIVVIKSR